MKNKIVLRADRGVGAKNGASDYKFTILSDLPEVVVRDPAVC
ncbi:MAG TPA: hypothetical protein VKZ51_07620 [Cyclobacteriaceae bacterium]|nr:hypothetical protein [Cyclobacteriaceae bacterium]